MAPVSIAPVRETWALILARAERDAVELVVRPLPAPGPGEALVRIRQAGICGTDLHIIGWNRWAAASYRTPLPLGHELVGEVVECGDGCGFMPGDRVTAETHLACGDCAQCRMDRGHTCERLQTFSRLGLGAFADFAVIPGALLRPVPRGLPDRVGAVMEPLGIGLRAAEEALSVAGGVSRILVSGCGPIGLFAIAALRRMTGAEIVAVDPGAERRRLACTAGADRALPPEALAEPLVADAAIETSGAPPALDTTFRMCRPGGRVVYCGLPSEPLPLDLTRHVVLREITLTGIYGRHLTRTWDRMVALLADGLDIDPVLTHSFPLRDYARAIETARGGNAGKVLLTMADQD